MTIEILQRGHISSDGLTPSKNFPRSFLGILQLKHIQVAKEPYAMVNVLLAMLGLLNAGAEGKSVFGLRAGGNTGCSSVIRLVLDSYASVELRKRRGFTNLATNFLTDSSGSKLEVAAAFFKTCSSVLLRASETFIRCLLWSSALLKGQ
ncbi:hypothetical protein LTR93_011124 [Exophiala xenobiotica]|nr:hypothetical protein LTR93_011124 [Exophiala xenobiotica]